MESLKLPKTGSHLKVAKGKGSSPDIWDRQAYADFASKAEGKNPETRFTKQMMDRAFRYAAKKGEQSIPAKTSWQDFEILRF